MKKIWKNICACSMALACGAGIAGCGKGDEPVSRDLDGDGAIASWETLFEKTTAPKTEILGEIVYVKDASGLIDINNHVNEYKTYVLSSNIDLGGREVSINLGKSRLYGRNCVISNFKLSSLNSDNQNIKCFMYGGSGIYDVRLFMGVQKLEASENVDYSISPLFDVPYIQGVSVKGRLDIIGSSEDGKTNVGVKASLLYSGKNDINISDEEGVVQNLKDSTIIRNVTIDGRIVLDEKNKSAINSKIGYVASVLSEDSSIYDAYAKVDVEGAVSQNGTIGGLVGENYGFVSSSVSTGDINLSVLSAMESQFVGGVAGYNGNLAEVKNCSTNINISYAKPEDSIEVVGYANNYFGGVVGYNEKGVVENAQSDAKLSFADVSNIAAGSIAGFSDKGIISYSIARGSSTFKGVPSLNTAQVCGGSRAGMIEKIVTTTAIEIDNSAITTNEDKVRVGMVTIFDEKDTFLDETIVNENNDSLNVTYFRRILVDGETKIITGTLAETKNIKFDLGLRHPFQVKDGTTTIKGENGEDVVVDKFKTVVPDVFQQLYYSDKCKVKLCYISEGDLIENAPTISYAKNSKGDKLISATSVTKRNLMDKIDFKCELNHQEVSLVDGNGLLTDMHFTLNKDLQETSYFGHSKYNGELAYFDKEFDKFFTHGEGACNHDQDEIISFLYDLVKNGESGETYVIKFTDEFFAPTTQVEEGEELPVVNKANRLLESISSALECLDATMFEGAVTITYVNNEITKPKSLDCKFFDDKNQYTLSFDIVNLEERDEPGFVNENAYIVYLTFNVVANSLVG